MGWTAWIAIGTGAALGAWLRWLLGTWLNPVFPTVPMGTLVANLLGGYLIGLAIAWFGQFGAWPPEYRLFVVTGFLGGLTTFSTFSGEVITLLLKGQFAWGMVAASTHLLGSLALTWLGIRTMSWLMMR
ncbi:fluoride efflux transporter CrcB [Chitinivorax sp. B]|uniref:fluoride efflux transporter CrcB n=1 Tax=Chitinivorax sp. B TaxID=2502235 RepID=UPI0010FA38E5|nr:fluoride efflux transporter CrcB [Chitinivorax sp. B]